jgi:hypothetical protein
LGFLNELGPIKIPLGAGISPDYTTVIKKRFERQNGFLNKEEFLPTPVSPSRISERLVPWILSLSFAYTFLQFLQLWLYKFLLKIIGKKQDFQTSNDGKQEFESDVDSDYDPMQIEGDYDDTSSESEDYDSSLEDENAQLCEEIVSLTRDLNETIQSSNSSADLSGLGTIGQIFKLLNQPKQLITRSQVKSLNHAGISNQIIPDSFSPLKSSSDLFSLGDSNFSARKCVVCKSDIRCIVLRPCGCLCLCDDCRIALAARKFKDCPCCRASVSGYSRIYEP